MDKHHIKYDKVHSPFISTSNSLVWAFRQASKKMEEAKKETPLRGQKLRLSVINAKAVGGNDKKGYYYVPPYFRLLKEKKVFDNGVWNYGGTSDFLIWATIPREAILCDFAIEDLSNLYSSFLDIGNVFRL